MDRPVYNKRETTKRGLHSWTTDLTPVDHSRGPLAKFRLPNNRPSTINPSLGRRDWRELFHYSCPLFISQSIHAVFVDEQ